MNILFIGDLHLGKHWLGVDLIDEQRRILMEQILPVIQREIITAAVVCGDIFDSIHPRKEALALWEEFLRCATRRGTEVVIIAGNHDNPAILEFGSSLFPETIHIASLEKKAKVVHFRGSQGGHIRIVAVPYIKPTDFGVETYEDALDRALEDVEENRTAYNVLVAHNQFGPMWYEDEERFTGDGELGREGVKKVFDSIIAGHIHKPEDDENFHYIGSIMPFTFAEAGPHRCMLLKPVGEKSEWGWEDIPLTPLHEILDLEVDKLTDDIQLPTDKYIRIKTFNSDPLVEEHLKKRYPLLLKIQRPKREHNLEFEDIDFKNRTDAELLESYYQNILKVDDPEQVRCLIERLSIEL